MLNPEKIWHQWLLHFPTWPVATLLWEFQKIIFQQYHSYMHVLQILFVISEENKLLFAYPPHLKNVTTLPCKMHNFFIWLKVCYIPPNVGGSEKAGCGLALVALKRTGCDCDMWQMQCQASNVTAKCSKWPPSARIHASGLFATDQVHRPPRSAKIQLMLQQDASATHPYRGLILGACEKIKKEEKFVHFTR